MWQFVRKFRPEILLKIEFGSANKFWGEGRGALLLSPWAHQLLTARSVSQTYLADPLTFTGKLMYLPYTGE